MMSSLHSTSTGTVSITRRQKLAALPVGIMLRFKVDGHYKLHNLTPLWIIAVLQLWADLPMVCGLWKVIRCAAHASANNSVSSLPLVL